MARKTVLEYPAEATPADNHILYLINGLTDRNITLRKLKDYLLGGVNRLVKDTPETDSGSVLTANGVNNLIARVGSLYMQYPFMPTPDEFYGVGTWLNISARAVGYGISDVNNGDPTSFISREAAGQGMDFADSDLTVDDQIVGGAYDGMYIRSVETYKGLFFRIEGGHAEVFDSARQEQQIIVHQHNINNGFGGNELSYNINNVSPGSGLNVPTGTGSGGGNIKANEVSSVNTGTETRPINRPKRIWIRII